VGSFTPHFWSAARSFWNWAELPPRRELRGGLPGVVLVGGVPFGAVRVPLGRRDRPLGTVTPCFFRQACTFGSCAAPKKPPPLGAPPCGVVDPALALEFEFEPPPQAASRRAAAATKTGTIAAPRRGEKERLCGKEPRFGQGASEPAQSRPTVI